MAMAMVYNGANDSTAVEIQNTLGFEGLSQKELNQAYKLLAQKLLAADSQVRFELANSIWYRQDFAVKQSFLDLNQTYFDALVRALDFSSPQALPAINGWVSDKTHGKIESIVDCIDPLMVMFLINAIYFKGDWTFEFDEEKSREKPFYGLQQEYSCIMMQQHNEFVYGENDDVQMIELPYGDGQFAMTVVLPRPEYDLGNLTADLTLDTLQSWIDMMSKRTGTLLLPKFKVEYEKKLNAGLMQLGIRRAFQPGLADFSGMSESRDLYIDKVKHKSYVKVNEKGTEAAAVTSVEMRVTSVSPEPSEFTMSVNRPFLFFIREKSTGAFLFMGMIYEPETED